MAHGDTALTTQVNVSLFDRLCRSMFIKLVSHLPEGQLHLSEDGVTVAVLGNAPHGIYADVNITHPSAYRRLLLGGSVGAAEAYMDGTWHTTDLAAVVRLFARNLSTLDRWESKFKWLSMPWLKLEHFARRNTHKQAKRNIEAHYDLGNKLYTRFLDETMMYSSAIYPDVNSSLSEAQQHKLKTICDKLQLSPQDHLLEIGTGWGGLAVFAAKHYGCQVTTTTISEEQHAFAQAWIEKENLSDRITLLKKDYRLLTGKYDKLVSIEMIEAVGKRYLANFFDKCSSLLHPKGLMLLQSIIIDDRRYESYSKSVDFIQKYIFPGGFLPSQLVLNQHIKKYTDLSIRDLHDIGLDYARTLSDWYEAFNSSIEALIADGYDDRFVRMWNYYLKYCEGGFSERTISTVQLLLAKPAFIQPLERA